MEPLLDAARGHCTEGEIVQSLQRVFGTYTETPVFGAAGAGWPRHGSFWPPLA
jgi:hypothetical protein